jgi:hypothetical protein
VADVADVEDAAVERAKPDSCDHCEKKLRNPRPKQRFCPGGRCRNAAWRANHPRRKRSERRPRISFEERLFFESIIEF